MTRLLKLTAASALLLGCASCTTLAPPPTAATTAQSAQTTKLSASTPSYDLELDLTGPQKIYSMADDKKLKPTSGEVMVSGKMVPASRIVPGSALHLLELHVLHVFSNTPIKGASVSITITSPSFKAPISVPIAVMYGAKPGPGDWHYGNNVALAPGNYTVKVVVNAERATFKLVVPK